MKNDKGSGMYILGICLVATLGGLLFGYDTGVISGAIEPMTVKFNLDAAMKGWVSGCVLINLVHVHDCVFAAHRAFTSASRCRPR